MEGKQLSTFIVALVSLLVTTIVVIVRCIVRTSIRGFGLDDGAMAIGQVLFFGTCVAVMYGCNQGIGVRDIYLTPEQLVNARHSVLIFQCFYLISLIFVKSSICFALLRITPNKQIRQFLYFIIFLSFCCGFVTMVACLAICVPVSASWTGVGKCAAPNVLKCVAVYTTVSSCITDFSCSILPFVILWNLQMAKKLKFTLAAILSLGFLASAATVVRAFYFNRFLATVDYVWGFSDLMIWSIIEDLIAITIGSVPSLKPLVARFKFMSSVSSTRRAGKKTGEYQNCESYNMHTQSKSKNQTRVITTAAEESESMKDLVREEGITISQEFRHEEEYEYHDRKPGVDV
ncbi:hypothetical protein AUEXF2481DRAFT_1584 [Aureobasidium subglaciale EXF-2481]|uniref:Rhodopsin domain-containing protein n=1 Tax=Aureobasidium subglaciale (strain EXF-2481) TaxID=1043005 RepID=A0A074YRG5_AURSE|nr:uncharacterized protein AUEXF2481DRAFT_1584 [Aureobasidium subglaciale EXF-2481]KEQ98749.1 hypothetical protein AUEXF2481DRAFT_1584 [Aureobasidium subglaciale EXF-2481]